MNKKHQSKLEDIENEVDSFKKRRGRPVGSKNKTVSLYKSKDEMYSTEDAIERVNKIMEDWVMPVVKNKKPFFNIYKRETEDYIKELEKRSKEIEWDAEWDNIEVPELYKIREPELSTTGKVILVISEIIILTLAVMVFIIVVLLLT